MYRKLLEGAGAFILILAIGLGIYFFRQAETEPASSSQPEYVTTPTQIPGPQALDDKDGDGLKDWEEALWKTDPLNPDTDGDGTPDGEETKQNRDPLVKGPNDNLFVTIRTNKTPPPEKTPALAEPTPIQIPTSLGEALQNQEIVKETPPEPTVSKPTPTESPEITALRIYGNALAVVLTSTVSARNEISSFENFLAEDATASAVTAVETLGAGYADRADRVKKIIPPQEILSLHNAFADKTTTQANTIKRVTSFGKATDIPLEEWLLYRDAVLSAGQAVYDIAVYFKQHGVSFAGTEPGSLFTLLH